MLGKPWGRVERGQNSVGGSQAPAGRSNSRGRKPGLARRVGGGERLEAQGGPCGLSLDVETFPKGSSHSPRERTPFSILDNWLNWEEEGRWAEAWQEGTGARIWPRTEGIEG